METFSGPNKRCRIILHSEVRVGGRAFAKNTMIDVYVEDCLGTMRPHYFVDGLNGVGLQIPDDAIAHELTTTHDRPTPRRVRPLR